MEIVGRYDISGKREKLRMNTLFSMPHALRSFSHIPFPVVQYQYFLYVGAYFISYFKLYLFMFILLPVAGLYLHAVTETKLVVDTSRGDTLRINVIPLHIMEGFFLGASYTKLASSYEFNSILKTKPYCPPLFSVIFIPWLCIKFIIGSITDLQF